MARRPAKPESSPRAAQQAPAQLAATVASQEAAATGADPQGSTADTAPLQAAPEAPSAGVSGTGPGADTARAAESVTIAFPLPAGIPEAVLDHASVVVTARPAIGRWRAGRKFTLEETAIPYRDLTEAQIAALTGDPELIVSLRAPRGAKEA